MINKKPKLEDWMGREIYIQTKYVNPVFGCLSFDRVLKLYSIRVDSNTIFSFEAGDVDNIEPFNGAIVVILK